MSQLNQYLQVVALIFIAIAWYLAFKASRKEARKF